MQSRRSDADQRVAEPRGFAIDDPLTTDDAHREARQVVLPGSVEPRELGRFTSEQSALGLTTPLRDAFHDRLALVHIELRCRKVVQEEQRLGADSDDVVDAHRDQVDADRVVTLELEGQLQLGSYAVGSGDQDRVLDVARYRAQAGKSAKGTEHVLRTSRLRERLDPFDELFTRLDVHSGVTIGQPRHAAEARRSTRAGQRVTLR